MAGRSIQELGLPIRALEGPNLALWFVTAPVGTTVPMEAFLEMIGAKEGDGTGSRASIKVAGTLWRNSFDGACRSLWVKVED